MDAYGLKNLINAATCFKSEGNPRNFDLILTNISRCFYDTLTTKTGISDLHLMVSTVLYSEFKKRVPKLIHYRDHSKFDPSIFRSDLREERSKYHIDRRTFDHCNVKIEEVLNKHEICSSK